MIGRWLAALAVALLPLPALAAPADAPAILEAGGFKGVALVADSRSVLWQTPSQCVGGAPSCAPRQPAAQRWPWASVTKQMLAVLVMKEVEAGRLALDTPASDYLPALGPRTSAPTLRQLLQHRAGLRNPNDTPEAADGWPAWYRDTSDPVNWCLAGRTVPGGPWRYNNCDSILLGAVLGKVTGRSVEQLFAAHVARPLKLRATSFAGSAADRSSRADKVALSSDEQAILTRFGPAGGLVGSALDLLAINRALLAGRLLSPAARAEMWKGDSALGFMGLSQWSFEAPLKGCGKPVRIIERRGAIGRFQVRNLLLPEEDRILILFTADPKLDFGEIWQGKGLSHDLLAAAACPTPAS